MAIKDVYNREKLLGRLFESLMTQTDKNFIWMVVDDGSIDNTELFIKKCQKDADFEIIYIKQQNGGKHRAHNTAVKNCQTDYFMIVDSDDFLNVESIKILNSLINKIDNSNSICGIVGCRFIYDTNKPLFKYLPDIEKASLRELYQKYKFKGDTMLVFKSNLLKEHLFPEIEGEKFISENVVFDQIGSKYSLLVTNEIIYYGEYQQDGYTNNIYKVNIKNPKGYFMSLFSAVQYSLNFKNRLRYMIKYLVWGKKCSFKYEYSNMNFKSKIIFFIAYPISILLFLMKKPKNFFIK